MQKKLFLLDIIGAQKELVTAFKKALAIVFIIVEDLAFFLI